MDNVLVFGRSLYEHNGKLDRVLNVIGSAGLTLNARKCLFGSSRVTYLRHRIAHSGIWPDNAMIMAVSEYPRPENITQYRSLLDLASFYLRFVKGFAAVRPLHSLLKKGTDFPKYCGPDQEEAMKNLRERLTSS